MQDIISALFKHCQDAVVVASHHGEVIYANQAARSHFATLLPSLVTLDPCPAYLWEYSTEQCTPADISPLAMILAGNNFRDREFIGCLPNRCHQSVAITGSSFELASQNFVGALLLIRPVPHQKPTDAVLSGDHSHDDLTGLVSRAVFMERLQRALLRTQQQSDQSVAILCLDITRLKAVNDTFGYLAGDRLLVDVARRIKAVIRPADTLSRLGGDEFTLLLEDVSACAEVITLADAIHDTLTQPFAIADCNITIGVSMGISLGNHLHLTADILLRQADLAMGEAKARFHQPYCVFEAAMEASLDNSLHLEMSLRQAIERRELYLEYQPIFLVRTQQVIGMESLVRWHHPTQGLLTPAEFISLAEKTGLIVPLGWWVLEESCRQLQSWHERIPGASDLFISVNMSSQQFAQKNVLDIIQNILTQTGLAPRYLKIEMTESVLIDHSNSIIEILAAIRQLGIKLSVDDFGTGYSSLSYLHRFPVDTLKIDRSFLENADSDFEKLEILQSVVRLAWNLGLEVVAEGIETQRHLAQVQALRCESGQGFLFSKPLSPQAMEQLLRL
ncbi:MAG: EAL domain-containing protein [Leptolyngbyaceae cyanobacterium]